jgi:SAM-dependent methyltransferase
MAKKGEGNNFHYRGYTIPENLVDMTGGGTDTWDAIANYHMVSYDRYAPISPDSHILEVGSGVGRDAIMLTDKLSPKGQYIGVEIIKPSIEWCNKNITPKFPNFTFEYLDIESQIHNPKGKLKTTDIRLPAPDDWADLIILQSVFTHMFSWDIVHYLKEFRRILKPGGRVVASFFIINDEAIKLVEKTNASLAFRYRLEEGCYINDIQYPEGAVGYTPKKFKEMLRIGGLQLDQPVHYGEWCGRKNVQDGQDIAVLKISKGPKLTHRAYGKIKTLTIGA